MVPCSLLCCISQNSFFTLSSADFKLTYNIDNQIITISNHGIRLTEYISDVPKEDDTAVERHLKITLSRQDPVTTLR